MDEIVAEDPPFLRIAETDEASAAEETVHQTSLNHQVKNEKYK